MYTDQIENCVPIQCVAEQAWSDYVVGSDLLTQRWLQANDFDGQDRSFMLLPNFETGELSRVVMVAKDLQVPTLLASLVNQLPTGRYRFDGTLNFSQQFYWALSQYRFKQLRSDKTSQPIRELFVAKEDQAQLSVLVEAISDVRDLINLPTNVLGPEYLSEWMETLATRFGASFNAIVGDALLEQGFPAIHAVGRAAVEAPRLLTLRWGESHHPCIALIGKGVCFDTGGLDLKPSRAMRLMKKDMGGAAHVLGLAKMIMVLKLPMQILVVVPAVENSVSANAYRPGDVIATREGRSVEIDNTDAEGRLILADAITYAQEHQPKLLIDIATLTGAARVAVGTEIAPFFCNRRPIADALMAEAEHTGEALWPLPLHQSYRPMLDSDVADIGNCGNSPYAGAITAALFLQSFVDQQQPWLHLDVMAYNPTARPGHPKGGEAMALRSLLRFIQTIR